MGNEQKIIDRIISDAENQASEIIKSAKEYADSVIKKAEEKASKEMDKYKDLAKAEAEKVMAKEISGAEMSAKKMILAKKQEILEETINLAKEKLFALSGEEYENTILKMIDNAKEKGEIILSAEDRKAFGEKIAGKGYNVSSETRELGKGFVIKNGDIEYNYSFDSIMTVERESIEQKIAQILFG
ncbi:MAG: hypothetical protein IAC55_07125 [Tyzzerella sp.]|uniref:V-type proton ATPase subunit E n=1 Tax=Candidatus Fimicola merdigallinarum TaxID=2840819 RepID=A0A9D9E152_9FIRM|nr:hypothetical protein [Candidatus Fimicola merdigallinarum]